MANPYTILKEVAQKFVNELMFPRIVEAFESKDGEDISSSWVRSAVMAAAQLGYNTEVYAEGYKIKFRYVAKRPTNVPWELRP